MLVGADSHDQFCMDTIISSTPLHKVRHFQFWHAILDVTYGAQVCVLQHSVFERHGSGITPHGIHDVSRQKVPSKVSSHYGIREEVWLRHWKKLLRGAISLSHGARSLVVLQYTSRDWNLGVTRTSVTGTQESWNFLYQYQQESSMYTVVRLLVQYNGSKIGRFYHISYIPCQ